MIAAKYDMEITYAIIIMIFMGGGLLGYEIGKNSPCTQVESIDIKPLK